MPETLYSLKKKKVLFCFYDFKSKEIGKECIKFLPQNQNRIKDTNKFSFPLSDSTGIKKKFNPDQKEKKKKKAHRKRV